jgi:hypothetical protein
MFHPRRVLTLTLGMALSTMAWAGSPSELELRLPQRDLRFSTLRVADAGTKSSLSVDDLGFSSTETQSDPQFQKDLEARSDMLKIHQTLGLITCVPMVTTYVFGFTAAKDDLMLHGTTGFATAGLYLTTASFAIFAPHVKDMKPSGNSELHQILAIAHGIFMVATPILGELAEHDEGYVNAHFISATGLVASYLAAMSVMTF